MTEVENVGVEEEFAAPETNDVVPEQHEEVNVESDKEINFRNLRERADRLEQERDKDQQLIREMQAEFVRRDAPVKEKEVDPLDGIDPSDWATFEQSQKGAQRIADSIVEKRLQEYDAKRNKEEMPSRLQKKFPDFDSIMTPQNVEKLQAQEPEFVDSLRSIQDEEKQAIAAYKFMKVYLPANPELQEERKMMQENAKLPKSVNSAGGRSPLSQAKDFDKRLTPELKSQLWKELNECSRG